MGGPCYLRKRVVEEKRWGKFQGPAATDNFQIKKFKWKGKEWHSVEQCFQATKFKDQGEGVTTASFQYNTCIAQNILATTPVNLSGDNIEGQYGQKVWKIGQSRDTPLRDDWETKKIEYMFLINLAKYDQNPDLCKALLETGDLEIIGPCSTWEWQKYNGLIQTHIRNLLIAKVDLSGVTHLDLNELEKLVVTHDSDSDGS